MKDAPADDIATLLARAPTLMGLFDMEAHRRELGRHGHTVLTRPDDPGVVERILNALRARLPFSAVRIGDGEMNLITLTKPRSETPALDLWAARSSMAQQVDQCLDAPEDLRRFGEAIDASVMSADIVGFVGLWMPRPFTAESLTRQIMDGPRGAVGQIVARSWARDVVETLPPAVVIATAHFYVALLQHLDALMRVACRVVCVTDREAVVAQLQKRWPSLEVTHVRVGDFGTAPFEQTLQTARSRLSNARPGDLYLIGAGPWAEPYCDIVKASGAVGVDLGSGFDLLEGRLTRPVHRAFDAMIDASRPE